LQIANEAAVDQRRLERGELLLPREAPVDLGDVDDVNRGCHWYLRTSATRRPDDHEGSTKTEIEGNHALLRERLRVRRVLRVCRSLPSNFFREAVPQSIEDEVAREEQHHRGGAERQEPFPVAVRADVEQDLLV